jgi:hypothetical protein
MRACAWFKAYGVEGKGRIGGGWEVGWGERGKCLVNARVIDRGSLGFTLVFHECYMGIKWVLHKFHINVA